MQRVAQVVVDVLTSAAVASKATVYVGDLEVTDAQPAVVGEGLTATRFFTFGGSTIATETVTGGGGAPPASWALLLGDGQGSAQVSMALKPDASATTGLAPASASDEVLRNAYEPYGAVRGGDHLVTSRGWLGQVSDADTGLVYLNARYYDPALGRFLSPDPLFNPASPKTLDPYRYADNNPVMFTDATGLTPCAGTGANEQKCLDSYNRGMRHSKTKPKWDLSPRNIVKAYGRLLWGIAGVVTPVPSAIGGVKTLIDFVKDPGKTWDSNWAAKKQGLSDGWTAYKSGWGLWTGGSPRDFWHNLTHSPFTNYVGVSWDNKDLGGMAQTTGTGIGVVGTIALTAGLGGIGAGEGLASAAAEEEAAVGAADSVADVLATPQVASPRLQNIVNDLYKGTTNPGRVGNGTTMDAIANEIETGLPTAGKFHSIKGQDYLNGLNNWLDRNPSAPHQDRLVAQSLADELSALLGGAG